LKTTKRVFVLVKAYPQPSNKYDETVCCAGIAETGEFVRLYPVRFRQLRKEARFERYDLIEVEGERPRDDHRPESFHVNEDSIKIIRRGRDMKADSKPRLWLPHVAESLDSLRASNRERNVSLGIVRPDEGSVRFSWESLAKQGDEDRAISASLAHQTSLIEEPLKPLAPADFAFKYAYTSNGHKSKGQIHDWEVQAAYIQYKRRYGDDALSKLKHQYQEEMPRYNLHLFLGTMKAHPAQFIIVGLLRTAADVAAIEAQPQLL
jgi:hypothetical protein